MLRKFTKRESKPDVWEGDEPITTEVREPLQPTPSDSQLATEEVLHIQSLGAGETLTIKTRNSTYRFIILDSIEQKILIRGGRFFRQPTEARLLGSAVNKNLRVGGIVVGRGLGITIGRRCIVTSPITEIVREVIQKTGS